jgi:hypothetical protein
MKMPVILALLLLLTPLSSYAWNHEGHRTVAAIAYDTLEPNERQAINAILKHHPFYEKFWRVDYNTRHPAGMALEKYAFIRAAGWPDDVRAEQFKDKYHNGTWHYVNFPVTPPNSLDINEPIGNGILLDQIVECKRVIQKQTSQRKRVNRAIMLAWLLHLVGDLHQPLHSIALVNNGYPDGDHGGNDFFIRTSASVRRSQNLHSFWDGLLGNSPDVGDAARLASRLQNQFPKTDEMMQGDVNDWAKQSALLGLHNAYQFKGVAIRGGKMPSSRAPILPLGYQRASEQIAKKQVALAGYRLAAMLADLAD